MFFYTCIRSCLIGLGVVGSLQGAAKYNWSVSEIKPSADGGCSTDSIIYHEERPLVNDDGQSVFLSVLEEIADRQESGCDDEEEISDACVLEASYDRQMRLWASLVIAIEIGDLAGVKDIVPFRIGRYDHRVFSDNKTPLMLACAAYEETKEELMILRDLENAAKHEHTFATIARRMEAEESQYFKKPIVTSVIKAQQKIIDYLLAVTVSR